MDSVGPLCPIANHLVAQLSSFSSLTCLNLSGMCIVNGSGVHGDLVHPGLKQLVLDNTESSGVIVRCAPGHAHGSSGSTCVGSSSDDGLEVCQLRHLSVQQWALAAWEVWPSVGAY